MYILTRYVVWETVKIFAAALLALTILFTLGMGVKVQRDYELPPLLLLQVMPFMLPEMFGITIPVAMLFSVSSVFGRMTGSNEIVAMKSAGISPMAVVWPVLVLASFLSLGTVWMYELAATWGRAGLRDTAAVSLEEIAYGVLHKRGSYDCSQFTIAVAAVEGRKLIRPLITIKGPPKITVTAAEAEVVTDWSNRQLKIICRQGEVEIEGQIRMSFPDERVYPVPITMPGPRPYHRDDVAMGAIPSMVKDLELKRGQDVRLLEAKKTLGVTSTSGIAAAIADCDEKLYRLKAEPYRRWSNGFACLCFALIGTPVAMLWRHADVLTNFFVCFLPILAVYYPLLMFSDKFATSGAIPPICFWTDNLVLAVPAIALLRWIVRR